MDRLLQSCVTPIMALGAALWVLWGTPAFSGCRNEPDPPAFAWVLVDDAAPQPNGMMLVGYREGPGGTITHVSFHRVVRVLPGLQGALSELEAARYTVVFTDGTLGPLTYVIFKDALYYGTDLDNAGLPRRVWIDPLEDGLNGNERLIFDQGVLVQP